MSDDAAGRTLGELAIAAAGIGTFDWDVVADELRVDETLARMLGLRADVAQDVDAFLARVHERDRPAVQEALRTSLADCSEYQAEYRVVRDDGTTRWIAAHGRTLGDPSGRAARMIGAAHDVTDRRDAAASVARVLETMPSAFFSLDTEWRFTYVNQMAAELLGRPREELLGGVVWELFPAADDSDFGVNYRRAVRTGRPTTFEAYYPPPLDAWYEARAWPGSDGLAVYFTEVTERREAQQRAAAAARRAALVATVTAALAETLESEVAVARLAHLVVPALADWCIVTLIEDDDGGHPHLRDIGWWHADVASRPLVEQYANLRLDALAPGSFIERVLASGEPQVVPTEATRAVGAVLLPGRAKEILQTLAPESAAILPVRGRGRTVGLLSLFRGRRHGPYTAEELSTAREVAGRAGLALDNSRLYHRQRRIAEGLQRSMLTAPPEPDHVEIQVRYVPAAEAAQVGGDWYDAFRQDDGRTVVVIGDVVGHDVEAAAAMGQLRSVLRGIAVATGARPAQVLGAVDRAMHTLRTSTIATAVMARLEQDAEQTRAGTATLRWSNAGHPPPVLLCADGSVRPLSAPRADLLLGVLPDTARTEHVADVPVGATVLLHTDGLVERRDAGLRGGLDRLHDLLAGVGRLPLADLSDEVLRRMLPDRPEDDVALVAVRLHPDVSGGEPG